ncbi:MAG: hypothetical protein IKW85_12210 [Muribaculaceae bacterium]|nr:hypothetical protein [Muribaculaceae bacterium]
MKIKFLSIMMAVAVALAFTSCDGKKKGAKNDDDSEKSESVSSDDEESYSELANIKPTGNPQKDAKAFKNFMEKYVEYEVIAQEAQTRIAEYYADKRDYKGYQEFQDEINRVYEETKSRYNSKYDKLRERMGNAEKKLDSNRPVEMPDSTMFLEEETIYIDDPEEMEVSY